MMKDSENSDVQNGHSRVTASLIKSILQVYQKPPSETTKSAFLLKGSNPNGRSLFAPTCGERLAAWNEEQDEWARHKAYELHKELHTFKGHHCDVHITDFFRCMFTKKNNGKRIGNISVAECTSSTAVLLFTWWKYPFWTVRDSDVNLDIQTASGLPVSDLCKHTSR